MKPKITVQKLENIGFSLDFLKKENVTLVGIGPQDILNESLKLKLGLIWTLISHYQIAMAGVEGDSGPTIDLLTWIQNSIPHYPVKDYTTSWRDGKALCHLVNTLKSNTISITEIEADVEPIERVRMAEERAEDEFGIPQILHPEDFVSPDCDQLSVMTYLSFFREYHENPERRQQMESHKKSPRPKSPRPSSSSSLKTHSQSSLSPSPSTEDLSHSDANKSGSQSALSLAPQTQEKEESTRSLPEIVPQTEKKVVEIAAPSIETTTPAPVLEAKEQQTRGIDFNTTSSDNISTSGSSQPPNFVSLSKFLSTTDAAAEEQSTNKDDDLCRAFTRAPSTLSTSTIASYPFILFIYGPGSSPLPTFHPHCFAAEALLRFSKNKYLCIWTNNPTESTNIPDYSDNHTPVLVTENISHSGFLNVVSELLKSSGIDRQLTEAERLETKIFSSVQFRLYNAIMYSWLIEDKHPNKPEANPFLGISSALSSFVTPFTSSQDKRLFQMNKDFQSAYEDAEEIFYFLSNRIGNNEFFFGGSRPSSLDAIILGHLAVILHTPFTNPSLHQSLRKFPLLVNYVENLLAKFYPEIPRELLELPELKKEEVKLSSEKDLNTDSKRNWSWDLALFSVGAVGLFTAYKLIR
eukprot:TRINITY_DN3376_c0_g1_i2.p1 TRINITY_DN3376_c0_g1~~TRINITY_DN3376_c0_g1_i2.p1  ORF type:complete len:713 (-),score=224.21 TRINITY_DN3376_c0_g1_i2:98-2005(-)